MSILIGILTFVLILISGFLILLVLAQKSKDGGMGAALGGGVTEATFGAETGNVLTKMTINASIAFFILSFGLYLGYIYQHKHTAKKDALPTIEAPAIAPAAAPATTEQAPAATGTESVPANP